MLFRSAKLIDNLAARLGRNQVVGISQTNDPVPEHQTKSKPLTGLRNDGKDQSIERKLRKPPIHDYSKAKSIVPGLDGFGTRPIHLLNPAVPLRVELDDFRNPSEVQTVPEPQSTPAKRHRVLVAEGPERIESNWWAGPTIRRNYFRVELDNSLWWWIYQDLTTQEWFLHGLYQ